MGAKYPVSKERNLPSSTQCNYFVIYKYAGSLQETVVYNAAILLHLDYLIPLTCKSYFIVSVSVSVSVTVSMPNVQMVLGGCLNLSAF